MENTSVIIKTVSGLQSNIMQIPKNVTLEELLKHIEKTGISCNMDQISINNRQFNTSLSKEFNEKCIVNSDELKKFFIIHDKKMTSLSHIENVLCEQISVVSQYHPKFSNIAENQCTWFSFEILDNIDVIKQNFKNSKFSSMYATILENASLKRQKYGKLVQGENIDDFSSYISTLKSCEINNDDNKGKQLIASLNLNDLVFKNNSIKCEFAEFTEDINSMKYKAIVINRYGQTFIAVNFDKYNNLYILCDSHTNYCGITTGKLLIEYVKLGSEYNYILWSPII